MFNLYKENNFSRTSNSLNCVNFTITLSVTFCIIQGDPHRPTQMDPTRPNPLSKEKSRPDPTQLDPTRPVDVSDPCPTLTATEQGGCVSQCAPKHASYERRGRVVVGELTDRVAVA